MNPAFSVIFFTSASGAGYGLLIVLSTMATYGSIPLDPVLGTIGLGFSFILVTAGLLSSTLHLGHPERAWRALSQWRSSWLSREGVTALITFGPWALLAYYWCFLGELGLFGKIAAIASILMSIITIYCTAMIYRSLKTIHQWCNNWTIPVYLGLSIMTGVIWGATIQAITIGVTQLYIIVSIIFILIGWQIKRHYWAFIDNSQHFVTPGSATGLKGGQIRFLDGPHTEKNYLLTEMGFQVARKNVNKLRTLVHLWAFCIPLIALIATYFFGDAISVIATMIAALSSSVGVLISRWLFFAEACHVVTLYYGANKA